MNRAHELDPLSPIINFQVGNVHNMARRYDAAISVCTKLANDNPSFAMAHVCLAQSYWAKRMYPQVIKEWAAIGQFSGERNESDFASALAEGFRLGRWKSALRKGIDARLAQRRTAPYRSAYSIAELYADLGDNDRAVIYLSTE